MILGLDISTSCTGYSILSPEGDLVELGYIRLGKDKDVFSKAKRVLDELLKINVRYQIDKVYIEENLQKFRPGFSSAKTLMTLARFNGIISYIVFDYLKIIPVNINVNEARRTLGIKIVSKKKGGDPTKDQVLEWVTKREKYQWPVKELQSGPRKGLTVIDPGSYDMADAYVIAQAGMIMNK